MGCHDDQYIKEYELGMARSEKRERERVQSAVCVVDVI